MAISLTRYVDITSGVGAAVNVGQRQLIALFLDDNALIPTGSQVNFTSAADVAAYFGSGSEEYARAAFYFGWISKNITAPPSITFARWNSVANAPAIFGAKGAQSITAWNLITAGKLDLTMGAFTFTMTSLNFSSAGSLSAVAGIIQSAIQAESGGGALWTGATVVWDASTQQFNLLGGATGAAVISVTNAGSGDILSQVGWVPPNAIFSAGSGVVTITNTFNTIAGNNNNFGSFGFMTAAALDQAQIVEAATVNLTYNNMFMYSIPCIASNAASLSAALAELGGCTLTLSTVTGEYHEMIPMMILAATDYNNQNATQNYMFQIFDVTADVSTDANANTYDGLNVNYYGQTQTAGQLLQFYQRGVMMGLPTNPLDQNTYANEIWLKDAMGAAIMTLLLALNKVSANNTGIAQVTNICQGVITQALFNGTISVGKALTNTQQLYITEATGNNMAWKQVQNLGYWLGVVIEPIVVDLVTEYQINYTLIYSKDDVIRFVQGTDILI